MVKLAGRIGFGGVLVCTILAVACATESPPAPNPSSAPTPLPTVTATPITPTPIPTPTTVATSAPPTPSPTSTPTGLLFSDATLDETSGWRALGGRLSSMHFEDGALVGRYDRRVAWSTAVRDLDRPETVLSLSASFFSSGLGYFGWLCGDSVSGTYYGVIAETDGSVVFVIGGFAGVNVLERYEDLGIPIPDGGRTSFGLDCQAGPAGLKMVATVDAGQPVAVYEQDDGGPLTFDVVGIYGESITRQFVFSVDHTWASGAGGRSGAISLGADALLEHVPGAVAETCVEMPSAPAPDIAPPDHLLRCIVQDEGAGAELVEYAQYDNTAAMTAAYEARLTTSATCSASPGDETWSDDGIPAGRRKCAVGPVGVRLDWTDERFNVLGSLIDLEGDYAATLADWNRLLLR